MKTPADFWTKWHSFPRPSSTAKFYYVGWDVTNIVHKCKRNNGRQESVAIVMEQPVEVVGLASGEQVRLPALGHCGYCSKSWIGQDGPDG